MKTRIFASLFVLMLIGTSLSAQKAGYPEKFGNTLNLGVGVSYYGYIGHPIPAFHANFEIDVVKNLTLAPFISFYSYQRDYYWGDNNHPYRNYYYRETVVPVGVKASYYFDELIQANSKWDLYAGSSVGFAIRNSRWENGYYGNHNHYRGSKPFYFELHAGGEYHINNALGIQLDLSTGISTIGLGIHF